MQKWQIENSEKPEISEKLFQVLFPSFRPGLNFHLKKGNRRENFRICCGIMYNRRKRYLKLVCHISNHLFKSKSQEITV